MLRDIPTAIIGDENQPVSTNTIQKIEEGRSGMIVRYLPTLCASSAWEHHKAYSKEPKTVVSFVWNENTGLRDIWYSNI